MSKEHPTPWVIVQYGQRYTPVVKRGKRILTKWRAQDMYAICDRRAIFVAQSLDETTAKEICDAVNERQSLFDRIRELTHSLEVEQYKVGLLRAQIVRELL